MATLQEIAEEAGVHPATVSRILNSEGEYKRPAYARRAEKVRRIARRLGYMPNAAARAVARRRFGSIALLQHAWRNISYLPQQLLEGIQDALEEHALGLTVSRSHDAEIERPEYIPRILRAWNADGLLVNVNAEPKASLRKLLSKHRIPSVWLNIKLKWDCVYSDDRDAGAKLTRHLLGLGHRDIRYLGFRGGGLRHYSKVDRAAGYAAAMKRAGFAPRVVTDGDWREQVAESVRAASRRRGKPAVWIGYSNTEIDEVLGLAVVGMGARVPDDLILATFGESTRPARLCVAEMRQPVKEVGRAAVAMLVEKIARPSRSLRARALKWELGMTDVKARYRPRPGV